MTIRRFYQPEPRHRIGIVGERLPPEAESALVNVCGYDVFEFESKHLDPAELATTSAVVFRQSKTKPRKITRDLRAFAVRLLSHDCQVFVEWILPPAEPVSHPPGVTEPDLRPLVLDVLNELQLPLSGLSEEFAAKLGAWFHEENPNGTRGERLTPLVHIFTTQAIWPELVEALRLSPPGPAPAYELKIEIQAPAKQTKKVLAEEEPQLLIRRAFHDCVSVTLIEVTNGLSSAVTLRAFAHLRDGQVGSKSPYLYFVKLGPRAEISQEFLAYQDTALENIPFHLGPRLRQDRCALGSGYGIIVSDYVTDAEALRDCARDGRAVAPIGNLLNVTLRAWQTSATKESISLRAWLLPYLRATVPRHRSEVVKQYGGKLLGDEFAARLPERPVEDVMVGAIHGDLHATNVMVRGSDAILIDFANVGPKGPLLWDLACLEGGLFVDGFVGDQRKGLNVLRSVRCLYSPVDLSLDMPNCHPSDGSAWFFACVRQIRMQARDLELVAGQYALALAVALRRKGCNPAKLSPKRARRQPGLERDDVRAMACVVAEWILNARRNRVGRK